MIDRWCIMVHMRTHVAFLALPMALCACTGSVAQNPRATVTVTARAAAPSPAMTDGVWLVGNDVQAGTYHTVSTVSGTCFWEVTTKSGTRLRQGYPGGGRPTVTLARGEQFRSMDCNGWALVSR